MSYVRDSPEILSKGERSAARHSRILKVNACNVYAQIRLHIYRKRGSSGSRFFKYDFLCVKDRTVFTAAFQALGSFQRATQTCTKSAEHSVFHAYPALYSKLVGNCLYVVQCRGRAAGVYDIVAGFLNRLF